MGQRFWKGISASLVGALAVSILRAVNSTIRWETLGEEDRSRRNWVYGEPTVLAFWHGHQLFMPWYYKAHFPRGEKQRPIYALISRSQDGRFIAETVRRLGIGNIAGSSSRGGREALIALIRTVKEGSHVGITPDGPKGPKEVAKPGVIAVARKTGAPILPVGVAYSRFWRFGSWDGMVFPKPFARGVWAVGEPIRVPPEADEEQVESYRLELERSLSSLTALAEAQFVSDPTRKYIRDAGR